MEETSNEAHRFEREVYKKGDFIWVFKVEGLYEQRQVCSVSPHHVDTHPLEGELTQDPKTGMLIPSKTYRKLEVGHTKESMLINRMFLERRNLWSLTSKVGAASIRLSIYMRDLNKLLKENT